MIAFAMVLVIIGAVLLAISSPRKGGNLEIGTSDLRTNLPEITGLAKVPTFILGLVLIGVGLWMGILLFTKSLEEGEKKVAENIQATSTPKAEFELSTEILKANEPTSTDTPQTPTTTNTFVPSTDTPTPPPTSTSTATVTYTPAPPPPPQTSCKYGVRGQGEQQSTLTCPGVCALYFYPFGGIEKTFVFSSDKQVLVKNYNGTLSCWQVQPSWYDVNGLGPEPSHPYATVEEVKQVGVDFSDEIIPVDPDTLRK